MMQKSKINKINMKNARKAIILITLITQITVQTSCVKEPLHETNHPNSGKIVSLTTVWNDRGEGINIPAGYTVKIGDYSATLQGTTNSVEHLLPAGENIIHIYNEAENMSVSGNIATADYSSGLVGWLFTGTKTVVMKEDKDYTVSVDMHQQVRQLTFRLNIADETSNHITAISASLSDVVGAIDINNGNPVGSAVTVSPLFTKTNGVYSSTIRLLGVMGAMQTFSLTLYLDNGNPQSYTITSDLESILAMFNTDKKASSSMQTNRTKIAITNTITAWIDFQ